MGDLLFREHQPATSDLVFGASDDGDIIPGADFAISGSFAPLAAALLLAPIVDVAMEGVFAPLAAQSRADYHSNTARPVPGQRANYWQRAREIAADAQERRETTARDRSLSRAPWAAGVGVDAKVAVARAGARLRSSVARHFGYHEALRASPEGHGVGHADAVRLRTARASSFAGARRAEWLRRTASHQDGLRDRRQQLQSAYAQGARHAGRRQFEAIASAVYLRRWLGSCWQDAIVPPPGVHRDDPVIPPTPERCYTPSPALLFAALAASNGELLFICEREITPPPGIEPVVVPVRRVYVVINAVTLQRVVDGANVPTFSLSLALDAASWAWGFEALLPASAQVLVDPGNASGPVELLVSVNGATFRVLAESISRERSFGAASIRIAGRGRNAVLAAPYAPVMTFANTEGRTARQLLDDVLTINGVPLGWTIDWGLTDWNVPAGVFAQQGTWIEALAAVAGAAGGYLLPHPTAQTLRVRHRYPVAPWAWDTVTPDFVLPDAAVARESLRWLEKPTYNRVFVSGQEVGVLGQVTRTGTAGDVLAPMVVDPLITEAAAARQRGLAVLADTGRQLEVTLRLPVLAETGIIEPGAFVEYQDGSVARLGLVRSTSVEAGSPEVWQTLGVETRV